MSMPFKQRLQPKRTREQLQQSFGELVMQLGGIQVDIWRLQQREQALLQKLSGLDAEARALGPAPQSQNLETVADSATAPTPEPVQSEAASE